MLLLSGTLGLPAPVQDAGLLAMVALSWLTTPKPLRAENGFTWSPIVEVAALFAGIFATMIAALSVGWLDRQWVPALAVMALGLASTAVLGWLVGRGHPATRRPSAPDR